MIAQPQIRPKIESLLQQWETRWRTRRMILYLPRILMASMGLGILAIILMGISAVLSPLWLAGLVATGIGVVVMIALVRIRFWGKEGIGAAREFDQRFGLQERVSTALELLDGRIQAAPELAQTQIDDAYAVALNVDPRKVIKFEVRWIEWAGVLGLAFALLIALTFYTLFAGYSEDAGLSETTQSAIGQAADAVRDITEEIATNNALTDVERENLLESLEVSLDELNGEFVTPEDAFLQLGELESDLRETSAEIRDDANAIQTALAEAADEFQNPTSAPDVPNSEDLNQGLSSSLQAMQDALNNMSPEERAALQQQLREAAQNLSENLPEVAQDMTDMAEALESGDFDELQEFLEEAIDNVEALEGQQLERLETAEQLASAADETQQANQEIAQAESGEQPEGEQGEQGDQNTGESGEQNAPPPGGQDQSDSDEDGQNSSETGRPVLSENAAGEPIVTEGEPASQDGPQARAANTDMTGAGDGVGSGDAQQRQEGVTEGTSPDSSGSQDGGGRETQFQSLYVGDGIEAEGTSNVFLEADAADSIAAEGDFQENEAGEVTVPYNQVFRSYENAANHALENDYVPLGMRDVVRDYFNALAPSSSQ